MPDVRLSGDFQGHKAGQVVDLSNDEYSEALHACVVGKVYPGRVPNVPRRAKKAAKKAAPPRKRAAAKTTGRKPPVSFGDKADAE